jgi:UDP-N-acetylglucosamine:LPS N-acetylglucosamine transferase
MKPLKVCLAASAGGHLSQLRKLGESSKVYVVGECNREHPLRVVRVLWRCVQVIRRERPDVVISTGAAPACLVALLGRLWGARLVWVDSITNVERLSLSGRLVRPFADLFLVQWPDLAERYRGAEYRGPVI